MSSGGHGFAASNGAAPGAMGGVRRGGDPDKKPPPLMDPTRQRDRHRILALFRPYRLRLGVVLVMIVFRARLGMVSPFLLRAVLDKGIFGHNPTLLTELVAGMIAIAVLTAAF